MIERKVGWEAWRDKILIASILIIGGFVQYVYSQVDKRLSSVDEAKQTLETRTAVLESEFKSIHDELKYIRTKIDIIEGRGR